MNNFKVIMSIIGLELLIIVFFTVNGAYASFTTPSSPLMQYAGLFPLAIGIYFYLIKTKKWGTYFSKAKLKRYNDTMLFCFPLVLVLAILSIGNGGIDTSSLYDLTLVLATQIMVVAFIEEMIFRGFMINILISKGFKVAVIISSVLFALTHSLQLLGGQSFEETLLQIAYAFFIGMVLSLLIVNKQSIVIAIAFHALNNFFIMMSQNNGSSIYTLLLVSILFIYSVYLWSRALKTSKVTSENIGITAL